MGNGGYTSKVWWGASGNRGRSWVFVVIAVIGLLTLRPLHAAQSLQDVLRQAKSPQERVSALQALLDDSSTPDANVDIRCYYYLAQAHLQLEQPAEAIQISRQGREGLPTDANPLLLANLCLLEATACGLTGEPIAAESVARVGLVAAAAIQRPRLEAKLQTELGVSLAMQHRTKEAFAALREALRIAEATNSDDIRAMALANLAAIASEYLAPDVSAEIYERLLDSIRDVDRPDWKASLHVGRGIALLENQEPIAAREELLSALNLSERRGADYVSGLAWFYLARTYSEEGTPNAEQLIVCLNTARSCAEKAGDRGLVEQIDVMLDVSKLQSASDLNTLRTQLRDRIRTDEHQPFAVRMNTRLALSDVEGMLGNWANAARLQAEMRALERENVQGLAADEVAQLRKELTDRDDLVNRLVEQRLQARSAENAAQQFRVGFRIAAGIVLMTLSGLVLLVWRRQRSLQKQEAQESLDQLLSDSVKRWEATFNAIDDPICVLMNDGQTTIANQTFHRLFGERLDGGLTDILSQFPRWLEQSPPSMKRPDIWSFRPEPKDEKRWFAVRVLNAASEEKGKSDLESDVRVVVFREVTHDVRLQEQLEGRTLAALDESQQKSEFLAIVSHELRTPLTSICGLSELMVQANAEPDPSDLRHLRSSAEQLRHIIDDLIDYSALGAKRLTLRADSFRPTDVVSGLAPLLVEYGSKATFGIVVDTETSSDTLDAVLADEQRYRQILTNLVSNAAKHTAEGEITVRLALKETVDAGLRLVTEVRDTGAGISDDDAIKIFEPFEQASRTETRATGGTGLGLAICKELVEAMGGQIQLTSQPGHGSCFAFDIAVQKPKESSQAERSSGLVDRANDQRLDGKPLRILIVDDDEFCRRVVPKMLREFGHQVVAVESGRDAIELVVDQRQEFDLILMDIMMPEMSGIEATRVLRQHLVDRQPQIVALTAKASIQDREACRAAAMDDCLSKPVSMDSLRKICQRTQRHR